jgi:hypothetical protein
LRYDGLTAEQLRDLIDRFGTPEEAALFAMTRSGYAEALENVGARVFEPKDGRARYLSFPGDRAACWKLIWAATRGIDTAHDVDASGEPRVRPRTPPPLKGSSQMGLYAHGKIQRAVNRFAKDASTNSVAKNLHIPEADARRIKLMFRHNLFRLEDGKLVVDDRVAHPESKYALRYLDDAGSRWLDPLKTLVLR